MEKNFLDYLHSFLQRERLEINDFLCATFEICDTKKELKMNYSKKELTIFLDSLNNKWAFSNIDVTIWLKNGNYIQMIVLDLSEWSIECDLKYFEIPKIPNRLKR